MTIAIPGLRRTAPKHRAIDRVEYLQHQVKGLEDLAGRQFNQIAKAEAHIKRQANSLRFTASHLGTAVVEALEAEANAAALERELAAQTEELVALRQFKANVLSVSTLPAHGAANPDDQETEGFRHVGDDFPDDYLDQMRQAWKPKPAVLAIDLGEATAEHRFPATARISA